MGEMVPQGTHVALDERDLRKAVVAKRFVRLILKPFLRGSDPSECQVKAPAVIELKISDHLGPAAKRLFDSGQLALHLREVAFQPLFVGR